MIRALTLSLCLLLFCASCKKESSTLLQKVDSAHSGIDFVNQVFEKDSLSLAYNYYFYNGAGVTTADFNNDGLEDIFLVGNHVSSRLYLNQGKLKFMDVTKSSGLKDNHWASGSTFVDINGDHLQDIYVCTVGKNEPNLLYVNQGIDKNGVPVFKEMAEEYGLDTTTISTQATFFDFDGDNDLDVFIVVNSQLMNDRNEVKPRNSEQSNYTVDKLYRNNGDQTFTDISEEAGITEEGYSLGLAVSDINNDGWPDIYVANDFITNDLIYVNAGDGSFMEKSSDYLKHTSHNGMGVDIADINQDGLMDITVVDMLPRSNRRRKLMMAPVNYDLFKYRKDLGYAEQHVKNTLQLNNGKDEQGEVQFSEVGTLAGMHSTDWSWAPLWADFDNNASLELYITNGYYKDLTDMDFSLGLKENLRFGTNDHSIAYQKETLDKLSPIKEVNFMYSQTPGKINLKDVSRDWGIDEPSFSHGAAFADFDNDGDLELVVNNLGHETFLYKNTTNSPSDTISQSNFLKVSLKGPGQNTNAIGTTIQLYGSKKTQTYYHSNVRGYLSSMGQIIHFGLGNDAKVDSLVITWPDGLRQSIFDVSVNQKHDIDYDPNGNRPIKTAIKPKPFFQNCTDSLNLTFRHKENNYVDFKNDPLFLKMYSKEGPAIAVSDIDGDGDDDFVVGGASGSPTSLFLQEGGQFLEEDLDIESKDQEDMGLLLFDVDGDGDNDLYAVSGNGESGSEHNQDRLYYNENGQFIRAKEFPVLSESGGSVEGADFDRDGDIDLFVGGKIVPGKYPSSPKSTLLVNENGRLTDGTPDVLRKVGMVSDAIWTDFDNDGWLDLIVVGEWTEIQIFKNNKGELEKYGATGLENTTGWWNSISGGDFDKDGDTDYILGNFGRNSYIMADKKHPIRLYAGDYDQNGKLDPILSYYSEDDNGELKEFPLHTRDALIDQIVAYKRRFKTYRVFSQADFDDVLKPHDRKEEDVLEAKILTSSFLENKGDGTFELTELPEACQVSPVYGALARDFDLDGNLDVVVTGNLNSAEPLYGNYDASNGVFLKGDGQGNFIAAPTAQSGLFLNGDQKSIVHAFVHGQPITLSGANDGKLKAYGTQVQRNQELIDLQPLEVYAMVAFDDGRKAKYEFYYGGSYLSQSSRTIRLLPEMKEVSIYDSKGSVRKIR